MLSIIGLVIGALVIIVYFAIIFPIPSIAALCVLPISVERVGGYKNKSNDTSDCFSHCLVKYAYAGARRHRRPPIFIASLPLTTPPHTPTHTFTHTPLHRHSTVVGGVSKT